MEYVICLLVAIWHMGICRVCGPSDFEYQYTSCDSEGSRWRVAVPRRNHDCDHGLPPPQKGPNCSFSCEPGSYLDVQSQECRPCSPGQYSLGGGVRFEDMITLPQGFSIENFDAETDVADSSSQSSVVCPKESGWIIENGEIVYIPTACVSRLSFSASLVRPGFVEFAFRMPANNHFLSLQVNVRNEQCQSYRDALQSMISRYAKGKSSQGERSNGEWQRRRVELRTGSNVVTWTVSNSGGYRTPPDPIRISKIDVLGLAFTRQCTLCPAGTFSDAGARECRPCAPGFYSSKGSETCGKCLQTQFSGPKAAQCEDRPACTSSDFYPVTEACVNGKTKTVYKMVLPAVCRTDLPSATNKPADSGQRPCPKCNPGMAKGPDGLCAFCPKDHFSHGNECKRCAVDTVPNYGFEFVQWETLPPGLSTKCEFINDEVTTGCNIGESWLASGSALISAPSLQKGIAFELFIDIEQGFNNPLAATAPSAQNPVAHVSVVFDLSCAHESCVIYFIEDTRIERGGESFYRFLAAFNGTQKGKVWSHAVIRRNPTRYMIAFVRSGAGTGEDNISDEARIQSINVTHIGSRDDKQGGGASSCLPCPKQAQGQCVPCPNGHMMHPQTQKCVKCDENSIVNSTGQCEGCGPELRAENGVLCVSDGHFHLNVNNSTLTYNLATWVNKSWVSSGVRVFAREGASYYHSFNVSILGRKNVRCQEHFENNELLGFAGTETTPEMVEGVACRLTVLPQSTANHSKPTMYSPLLLATQLQSITNNRENNGWKLTDQVLEYEGVDKAALPLDVHLWFSPVGSPSQTCPNANRLVVTARCTPARTEPQLRLPHPCPDGTCDGCLYHLIVEAAQACPVCNAGDYTLIRGECVNGKQTVHFIPDKHCVLSGKQSDSHEETCSVFSTRQQAFLLLALLIFILLFVSFIIICRRNHRLEYKYTRLVESRTGELPAAESCGVEEGEEDEEERVTFSKGKRRLFGRNDNITENAAFVPLENED